MKRYLLLMILWILCCVTLCACSAAGEEAWDCTVECMEESDADSYVISYSDAEIVSSSGVRSI